MLLSRCKFLLAGLSIAAAAVAAPAHAGFMQFIAFAPGVYYFDGACTTCDRSAPLAPAANDTSGVLTVRSWLDASFSISSPQIVFSDAAVFNATGSQPTGDRGPRDITIDNFFSGTGPNFSFASQSTGTWTLASSLGVMSGTGGSWATSPVPEPQGWALMLVGLAAAGALGWSRRRA